MRVLVCGGRNYNNREKVFATLDAITPRITTLINGVATGADAMAEFWAASRNIEVLSFPADWKNITRPGAVVKISAHGTKYDAAAGPFRNARMIKECQPDLVIAFPGHLGTRDMILQAVKAGIEVREIS